MTSTDATAAESALEAILQQIQSGKSFRLTIDNPPSNGTGSASGDADLTDAGSVLEAILEQLKSTLKVVLPVWIEPGPNCVSFAPSGYVQLSGLSIGATATIVTFPVPDGFNGVIYDIANTCNASAFTDGSGQLVWAIQIDTNYAQNYNAIQAQRGTVNAPAHLSCPLFLKEGQIVSLVVTNVSLTVSSGPVIGGLLGGWFYPADEEPADTWA
jgi:hypothetical protein